MRSRKGISPLIAVILLIAFTLVIAGLVAGWVTQFAQQQRQALTKCSDARLLIRGGVYNDNTNTLSLTVDNYGKVDLGFRVVYENTDGSITSPDITYNLSAGSIQSFSLPAVSGDLKAVSVQSKSCPGAQDILNSIYINGLGA